MSKKMKALMRTYGDFSDDQLKAIIDDVKIVTYPKGYILVDQGGRSNKCYYVLSGLIRQYNVDEMGREVTYEFYTEGQSATLFSASSANELSEYTLVCLEASELIVGEMNEEAMMYEKHEGLQNLVMKMMGEQMVKYQDKHNTFLASTPEERYKQLMEQRPDLIGRVPQHQLASYLGITPESLSRIKGRLSRNKLKMVR